MSTVTHNKLNQPHFLNHDIYYTVFVTEGQQTSINFHRPMLHRNKKYCINEESTNTVK